MQRAILQGACSPRAPLVGHRVVGGGIRRDGDGVEVPGRAARTGRETLRAPAKAEGRWCHETAASTPPAAAPNWSPLAILGSVDRRQHATAPKQLPQARRL